jgi:hypothetical protein
MESMMLTIKFAMFYGFIVLTIALLGATVIAGLYQVLRNRGGSLQEQVHESHMA